MQQNNKKYCLFPRIEKKHFLFLLFIVAIVLKKVIKKYLEDEDKKSLIYDFFKLYFYNIGDFISIIPYLVIKYKMINNNKTQLIELSINNSSFSENQVNHIHHQPKKKNFCLFYRKVFIYTFVDFLAQIGVTIYLIIDNINHLEIKNISFNSIMIISTIAIISFSRCILADKFKRHTYFALFISILCLIILSIFDIYLNVDDFDMKAIIHILIRIISNIFYSYTNVSTKVILDNYYLTPYSLLLLKAIFEFIYLIIFSIPFFIIKIEGENEQEEKKLIYCMFSSIFENDYTIKILSVIGLVIISFIYNISILLLIDKFTPNNFIVAKSFENFLNFIYSVIEKGEKFLVILIIKIILYILLIFSAFIYNEFIVINICGLAEETELYLVEYLQTIDNGETDIDSILLNNQAKDYQSELSEFP